MTLTDDQIRVYIVGKYDEQPAAYTATLSSHGYIFSSLRVGLTHSWYRTKAEVQHQILLQNAPDGGGGLEDCGAAFGFDSEILGRRIFHYPDLMQSVPNIHLFYK